VHPLRRRFVPILYLLTHTCKPHVGDEVYGKLVTLTVIPWVRIPTYLPGAHTIRHTPYRQHAAHDGWLTTPTVIACAGYPVCTRRPRRCSADRDLTNECAPHVVWAVGEGAGIIDQTILLHVILDVIAKAVFALLPLERSLLVPPCGIPFRVGYHAARDTVSHGLSCRIGCHAAWDTTMLRMA
jgi:hypothetical protein